MGVKFLEIELINDVDSIPILHWPPFIIILIFFLNSSKTSSALTGLKFEDLFALGIASGKLTLFKMALTIKCFGNLMATVFNFAQAEGCIFELCFFFKTNVIGPGQKCLYNFLKLSFIITSPNASFKL